MLNTWPGKAKKNRESAFRFRWPSKTIVCFWSKAPLFYIKISLFAIGSIILLTDKRKTERWTNRDKIVQPLLIEVKTIMGNNEWYLLEPRDSCQHLINLILRQQHKSVSRKCITRSIIQIHQKFDILTKLNHGHKNKVKETFMLSPRYTSDANVRVHEFMHENAVDSDSYKKSLPHFYFSSISLSTTPLLFYSKLTTYFTNT